MNKLLSPTLLAHLLLIYWGLLALLYVQVPPWLWPVALIVSLVRLYILKQDNKVPSAFLRWSMIFLMAGLLFLEYQQWFSLEPMLILLLVALSLKLWEIRNQRDLLLILFLSYFVLACAFLFNQSVVYTALGFLLAIIITSALLILHRPSLHWRDSNKKVLLMFLQAMPLMLVVMLALPRVNPLWAVPLKSDQAVTGISDSMSPGAFSSLVQSDALAMRVTIKDGSIPTAQRYWRGLVFDEFDGLQWQRSEPVSLSALGARSQLKSWKQQSNTVSYEVLMEASGQQWLFGVPDAKVTQGNESARYTEQGEIFLQRPIYQRIRYEVETNLKRDSLQPLSLSDYRRYTALPRNRNPETQKIAHRWRSQAIDEEDYIQKVLDFYRQAFTYTLFPPKLGVHSVDEFLFGTQQGFCEHYASSFTVLMRSVGIPSRIVVGYQGGEWNSDKTHLRIYQRDAHAWNEVWLGDKGWVRVDPTAAVAQVRVEQGVSAALPQQERQWVGNNTSGFEWLNQLYGQWQVFDYNWQRWVLSYDTKQQQAFLERLLGKITPLKMALLIIVPLLVLGVIFIISLQSFSRKNLSQERKLYQSLQDVLSRSGIKINPGETVGALCDRAVLEKPQWQENLMEIKAVFEKWLYQGTPDYAQLSRLKRLIKKLNS